MAALNRVFVGDAHCGDLYLRSTWRPDRRLMTISVWRDSVCIGVVRVEPEGLAALIVQFGAALGDASLPQWQSFDWSRVEPPRRSRVDRLIDRLGALTGRRRRSRGRNGTPSPLEESEGVSSSASRPISGWSA